MNECNASINPSGPIGAPLCANLPIPVCTHTQYVKEIGFIHSVNAQYDNGPLGMEEHLATDQGCKIGPTMMVGPSRLGSDAFGLEMLLIILAIGVRVVLLSWNTNTKGGTDEPREADQQAEHR